MLTKIPSDWQYLALSQVAKRIRRTLSSTPENILMITSKGGFIPQSDKYSKFMAGESLKKYTELYKGEFAYNKGNSKTYPQGCIYQLQDYEIAAVPNVYISFVVNEGKVHDRFIAQVFGAGGLNNQLKRVITSSARSDGLLNISIEDFFACKVPLPPPPRTKKDRRNPIHLGPSH